jgi:hypothetical protein
MNKLILILVVLFIGCSNPEPEVVEIKPETNHIGLARATHENELRAVLKIRNVMTALVRFKQSHYEQYGVDFGLDEFVNWSVEELAESSLLLGYDQTTCVRCHEGV